MTLWLEEDSLFPHVAEKAGAGMPVLLYGMGNGAEKVMRKCQHYGIAIKEIFASDEFVRGQQFAGYLVKSCSQIIQEYDQAIVLVAFGSADPVVLQRIKQLAERFEVLVPDLALFGEDKDILSYGSLLEEAYYLYEPESREIYNNLINYKITGKLKYLEAATTPKEEAYSLLGLKDQEVYVDAGAYDGDTIREFCAHMELLGHSYKKIYAIEPDPKNFRKLETHVKGSGLRAVELIQAALSNQNGFMTFDDKAGRSSSLSPTGRRQVLVNRLDDLINEPVTLLKMDVEGAEREALDGSQRILKEHRPRLIISAYHRSGDLMELARQIKNINPDYKLSLRHHPYVPAWDTNIYAL